MFFRLLTKTHSGNKHACPADRKHRSLPPPILFPQTNRKKQTKFIDFYSVNMIDTGKGCHDPDVPGVAEMLLSAFDVHADEQ